MATIKSNRFNFTKASLDALPIPAKRTWVYDTKVPQLGLTLLPSGSRGSLTPRPHSTPRAGSHGALPSRTK